MPVQNSEIAEAFSEVADLLEILGGNVFRVRAYRNAARLLASWPASLAALLAAGRDLPRIPGIGADLEAKVRDFVATRRLALLDELRAQVPSGVAELLRIPGLGPKRVRQLMDRAGIRSVAALRRAAAAGRVRELEGFGARTEARIIEALASRESAPAGRMRLAAAEPIVEALLAQLRAAPGVVRAAAAGSFRRRLETVGDIDLLVSCRRGSPVMRRFVEHEDVARVLSHGETRSTVLLRSGIQVDLRVVPDPSYGAALHYFTGSKAHNIAVRGLGQRRGLKINEYGIFRGPRKIGGRSEEEVFSAVGLPYIEPELREDRGEIEAAREGRLPRLVEHEQIRGDLHAHTDATDGRQTLEEMAAAARRLGYEYLAITDHSRRLTVAHGLTLERLERQLRRIDELNARFRGFRLLKGIEVDILENGSLDLPDRVLAQLDLAVCSIHSRFELSRRKQTERLIRAMDHPACRILGHPTTRLIGARAPIDVDLEKVLVAARERGRVLELNAQPERMDLSDVYCRLAKEIGVRVAISTDAHSTNDLGYMRFGVSQARRAWLEGADVVNTLPWPRLEALFTAGRLAA